MLNVNVDLYSASSQYKSRLCRRSQAWSQTSPGEKTAELVTVMVWRHP